MESFALGFPNQANAYFGGGLLKVWFKSMWFTVKVTTSPRWAVVHPVNNKYCSSSSDFLKIRMINWIIWERERERERKRGGGEQLYPLKTCGLFVRNTDREKRLLLDRYLRPGTRFPTLCTSVLKWMISSMTNKYRLRVSLHDGTQRNLNKTENFQIN